MRESILLGCELVCVLFALVCVIGGGMAVIAMAWKRIADARREAQDDPRPGWQFSGDIRLLDRWCAWYFPITEDICQWLLTRDRSIGDFRDHLCRKYGERHLETPAPDPKQAATK